MVMLRHVLLGMVTGLMLCLGGPGVGGALAQTTEQAEAALAAGVQHQQAGDLALAVTAFREVFEADPGYLSPQHGSTAYRLGSALLESGQEAEAFPVWWTGLQALADRGVLDVQLADAFVREVYARQRRQDYAAAAEAYIWMLRALDAGINPTQRALITAHLEPLSWILPADVQARTGLRDEMDRPAAGAGELLASWWRSQDALPATPQNERLQEHLARVAYAQANYMTDDEMDDRARIYVRLGPPYKSTKILFNSPEFLNKVVFRQLTVISFDFPENEFWVYNHIDHAAHYLFINDLGYYELGTPNDLLPSVLNNGLTNSERGMRKSEALVRTMEEIYEELSLLHDNFAVRYQDVADYAELFDQQELLSQAEMEQEAIQAGIELDDVPTDLSGTNVAGPVRTDLLPELPHSFAQGMVARATYEDGMAAQRRDENVPDSYTDLFRDTDPLPVVARTARFLDADGTTRTDVYWGLPPQALQPSDRIAKALRKKGFSPPEPYLIVASVMQQDERYIDRAQHINRHLVGQFAGADDQGVLEPQTYTVPGGTGLFHLAVQWDQYVAVLDERNARVVERGPLVKRQVFRSDSLLALSNNPGRLVLSDLKPVLFPVENGEVVVDIDEATPFPFGRLASDTPLGLYFEVYHLNYDTDDRTRYTIAYEVARHAEGGLFRKDKKDRIAAGTEYTGSSRTTQEYLLLDLADWQGEGTLDVTVRVTDEVTNQQVERTLAFRLVDG
ncbi:MAG TPA: GWxTD domain-containing protein [Rhodothermales bacterium]|nr:GWxTD domain-containing protein [Rhodothermales bacterium]